MGSPTARIYYQLKESLNMLKTCSLFLGSTLQECLAPAVKFVILMAQRPSANIVGLRVRENFIRSSKVLTAAGK